MARLDLFGRAAGLAQALCVSLKAQVHPPGPEGQDHAWKGECCVWPGGEVAYDNCCEGKGQAWVTVQGGGPTVDFPNLTAAPLQCGGMLVVTYEVGVLRCVGTEANPTCEAKERSAQDVLLDLQAMVRGVACYLNGQDAEWSMGAFNTIGPEGGCAGASVTVNVQEEMPCC